MHNNGKKKSFVCPSHRSEGYLEQHYELSMCQLALRKIFVVKLIVLRKFNSSVAQPIVYPLVIFLSLFRPWSIGASGFEYCICMRRRRGGSYRK